MADHYQTIHNNFKRLVAYGCSNTMGEELADHLCLGISFDECNKLKKKYGSVTQFEQSTWNGKKIADHMVEYDVLTKNWQLSYPGVLANLLGLDYDIRAETGNSQCHIYWQLVHDFELGKIEPTDMLLIGCTLPPRYMIMQNNKGKLFTEGRTIPLAQELFPEEAKSIAVLYSDEKFVWEYYNNLWLTKTFAETHKLTLMIVPTTIWDIDADHPDWIYKDIHPLLKKYCKKVWQTLKESVMVTDQGLENFFENPDKPNHAGWGHYPQHNHKAYAQHIYDRLELFGNFIRI